MEEPASKMKYYRGESSMTQKPYEGCDHQKPGRKRRLSLWTEFLMTLVWLRLGLPSQLIATLFGIGVSTFRVTVFTWVHALHTILVPKLVPWPSKETVKHYLPQSFHKDFPDVRVIIDATELFIQKPKDPDAQHKTYSSYKSRNTIKLLVGITPNGAFSFVSKMWTGNISDKFITKQSGLLDLIEPGDSVMADRGFQIEDLLLPKGARLVAPPFTKKCSFGKNKRLNASEIIRTRKIAHLRIHVERAIERMKRWDVIDHIPLLSVPYTSEIVSVIAAFCNLLPPLVQDE